MIIKNEKIFFCATGLAGIILSLFIFTACYTTDTTAPTVTVNPVNAATGVSITGDITLTFSEAMDSNEINGANIRLLKGTTEIASVITYSSGASFTAVINPEADLEYSTKYTVNVNTDVADKSGNTLASAFTSTFTTMAAAGTDPGTGTVNRTVKMVFVGDINLATKVGKSVDENCGGDYNFPFVNVESYLRGFDLTFGNLESIISNKGTTTKPLTGVDLRAKPAAVNGLAGAGFDIVTVANNHAGDFGEAGMLDSLSRLTAAGISYVGGGSNLAAARKPVIKEVNGVKIACLGYTGVPMFMDSYYAGSRMTNRWLAKTSRAGVAWASDAYFTTFGDSAAMAADIKSARLLADVVVVMIHFGWEYEYVPRQTEQDMAHAAIDAGAALVIGSHPHVCQATEKYNGGFIAYSLGNFVFDISEDKASGATTGMIVEATYTNGVMSIVTKYSQINEYYQVSLKE